MFLAMTCVHKDEEIYDSPMEYRVDRFEQMWRDKLHGGQEDKGWFFRGGKVVKYPLMPWGGGHFMVPVPHYEIHTQRDVPFPFSSQFLF